MVLFFPLVLWLGCCWFSLWWFESMRSPITRLTYRLDISSRACDTSVVSRLSGYWPISFYDFFLYIRRTRRDICSTMTRRAAASVQCDGRHSPDEAFGIGQQQPVDAEQRRGQQFFQRSRAGWSTAPSQARLYGSSQRTSSSLARNEINQQRKKERKKKKIDSQQFCTSFLLSLSLGILLIILAKEKKKNVIMIFGTKIIDLLFVCLFHFILFQNFSSPFFAYTYKKEAKNQK